MCFNKHVSFHPRGADFGSGEPFVPTIFKHHSVNRLKRATNQNLDGVITMVELVDLC